MDSPFPPGWWSFDLGDYRPCDGTYQLYPYSTLPPIDERRLQGRYQWLEKVDVDDDDDDDDEDDDLDDDESDDDDEESDDEPEGDALERLVAATHKLGRKLPAEFVRFFQDRGLRYAVPSCTACEWDLSAAPVPCKVVPGAYTVRFLRDQQDCLFWYLHLGPDNRHHVICSPIPFDDKSVKEKAETIKANTWSCAPHFEHFIYRWWQENTLWELLDDGDADLSREQRAYLEHCARNPPPAT